MISDKTPFNFTILAKIVSAVFHPLLMLIYGMLIMFYAPTILGYLPNSVKKILFFIILINNILIPLSLLPYLRYRNIITSWSISERKERVLPLIISSLFYSVTVYILYKFHIPVFIKSFVMASALIVITMTIINFWWKISIHSVAAGALLALVLALSYKMRTPLLLLMITVIFSAGLVMTSRLYLNSHRPAGVWAGFFLGLSVAGLSLILL
jgi:hypothetical protein